MRRGWDKTELHRQTGLSRATIDALAYGRPPIARTVRKLALALDIPMEEAMRLAGLAEKGISVDPEEEARKLLARLPERRRKALERILVDERRRYDQLTKQARADYERALQRVREMAKLELGGDYD